LLDNELTREAVEYIEKAAYTKEQLETYDKWKIAAMTERSALKDARKEGMEEGIKEGVKKGVMATALKMLKKGVPVEDICEYTGLSREKVMGLT